VKFGGRMPALRPVMKIAGVRCRLPDAMIIVDPFSDAACLASRCADARHPDRGVLAGGERAPAERAV
jgi:hypothetical protein